MRNRPAPTLGRIGAVTGEPFGKYAAPRAAANPAATDPGIQSDSCQAEETADQVTYWDPSTPLVARNEPAAISAPAAGNTHTGPGQPNSRRIRLIRPRPRR